MSEARRTGESHPCRLVGMSTIKQRRLEEIEVGCHPGMRVGRFASFYFCPRSILLYILHRGNHPELDYAGGQRPMVHLCASDVSLLEVDQLMDFMQEAGEPPRVRFAQGPYGPYAENLRHVLSRIEGHFVIGYGDAEDDPSRRIELRPAAFFSSVPSLPIAVAKPPPASHVFAVASSRR